MTRFHLMQAAISALALAAAILHSLELVRIDTITVSLLALSVLPWLAQLLVSAELPGGWKVQFRELKSKQELQGREVRTLRFLARSFLTDSEAAHLGRLAASQPFAFSTGPTTDAFKAELRRLRGLGLLKSRTGASISSVLNEGCADLKEHVMLTDSGREYLALRAQVDADTD